MYLADYFRTSFSRRRFVKRKKVPLAALLLRTLKAYGDRKERRKEGMQKKQLYMELRGIVETFVGTQNCWGKN
jgi:hypothetical protein